MKAIWMFMLSLLIGSAGYAQRIISQDTYRHIRADYARYSDEIGPDLILLSDRARPYLKKPKLINGEPSNPKGGALGYSAAEMPPMMWISDEAYREVLRIVVEALGKDIYILFRAEKMHRRNDWNIPGLSDLEVILISDMSGKVMHVMLKYRDPNGERLSGIALHEIETMVRKSKKVRVLYDRSDTRFSKTKYLQYELSYIAEALHDCLSNLYNHPESKYYGKEEEYGHLEFYPGEVEAYYELEDMWLICPIEPN